MGCRYGSKTHEGTATSKGKWLALTAALLGWMFDGFEMGLFPLVAGPALLDLGVSSNDLSAWLGIVTALFLVGAATGGVFFGWLGDRIGRVQAMMLSVLTYALVSGVAGFATAAWQVGALRFVAALGMGGEWSLGVALSNEIWPDRSRAFLAGLIGAAANVGYLCIALMGVGWPFMFRKLSSSCVRGAVGKLDRLSDMCRQCWQKIRLAPADDVRLPYPHS